MAWAGATRRYFFNISILNRLVSDLILLQSYLEIVCELPQTQPVMIACSYWLRNSVSSPDSQNLYPRCGMSSFLLRTEKGDVLNPPDTGD
jgi:hypothetical protein